MYRDTMINALDDGPWDILVVGGGCVGLGVAVDAATRGYRTLLLERGDFGQGTSSRSTKLIHGGVRYLRQGRVRLVREALRERARLHRNAPHLVWPLDFVIPCYGVRERLAYGVGLRAYDALAGRDAFPPVRIVSGAGVLERVPNARRDRLRSGVIYSDGQFDDARLALSLAQTAVEHGAIVANYVRVDGFITSAGRVAGVLATDTETGHTRELQARVVVNAAGPWADQLLSFGSAPARPSVTLSRGSHLVLPGDSLGSTAALMVPTTDDGRVFFAVPWLGRVIVGTTDVQVPQPDADPAPSPDEEAFLLRHASQYLDRAPDASDVLSRFAGLRALARPDDGGRHTKSISREHSVSEKTPGLVTVVGGKWTTYRKVAQDAVDIGAAVAGLARRPCLTDALALHGAAGAAPRAESNADVEALYGGEAAALRELTRDRPELSAQLHPDLPYTHAHAVWAARHEMARTVEDVLARRTRALLLDAAAAMDAGKTVARLLAAELGWDEDRERTELVEFRRIAAPYLPSEPTSGARPASSP